MAPASVRFELVEPLQGFQCCDMQGSVISIGAAGFETDDPQLIDELDHHPESLRRVEKRKAGK